MGGAEERTTSDGAPACAIVDLGHRRALDLAIELPESELQAVMSHEQWSDVLDRIAREVTAHRTTLVFVNTRRMAERIAHLLGERLGFDRVAAHHGSLSRDRRFRLEERLRAGDLKALVATASLELGIDIGPVELVCQIGSARSLGTFLQRVGRSGHARGATPKGRLYPTTRDELVESAALLRGVRSGKLDAIEPPVAPLDILAQQIVAAAAAEAWREDDLYALMRRAGPYAALSREDFDAVVEMLAEGIQTGRGRRGAYLHRDRVNGLVRGRRFARIAALTSGGAIPETADYKVVADPDDVMVGTVNEDWAIESMGGDVFLLGSTSWRIRRVEPGIVRVIDAAGAPPSVPFWLGEAPGRTAELSIEVSDLREQIECTSDPWRPGRGSGLDRARGRRRASGRSGDRPLSGGRPGRAGRAADPARRRLRALLRRDGRHAARRARAVRGAREPRTGARPSQAVLPVLRLRAAGGRRRRCGRAVARTSAEPAPAGRSALSLVAHTVRETFVQAVLAAPMFQVRWRWNLGRALAVLRQRGGKRNPPPIQRMEADDLMVAVFPGLAACQDNAPPGPVEIPDHPLVRQTLHDCLHEATDVDGLVALLEGIESRCDPHPLPRVARALAARARDPERTALHLSGRRAARGAPHAGGGPAPRPAGDGAGPRRARSRRHRARARRSTSGAARRRGASRPVARADRAATANRSGRLVRPARRRRSRGDRRAPRRVRCGWPPSAARRWRRCSPAPPSRRTSGSRVGKAAGAVDEETAAVAAVRGHLASLGPCTAEDVVARTGLSAATVECAVARLEGRGLPAARPLRSGAGRARPSVEPPRSCASGACSARIHRYTTERLRREIEPVTAQDFVRFLLRWQHVAPGTQVEGREGVLAVIEQLQGFEIAAGAWEATILPARVAEYRPEWLDDLCLAGAVMWARLGVRTVDGTEPRAADGPDVAFTAGALARHADELPRARQPALAAGAARGEGAPIAAPQSVARDVLECLRTRGALFYDEIVTATGRPARAGDGRAVGAGGARPRHRRRLRQRAGAPLARASAGPGGPATPSRGARSAAPGLGGATLGGAVVGAAERRGRCRRRDAGGGRGRAAPGALRRGLSRSRGARDAGPALAGDSSARCGAWRRGGPRAAGASSPASWASSTRCRRPWRPCVRRVGSSGRVRSSAWPPWIR